MGAGTSQGATKKSETVRGPGDTKPDKSSYLKDEEEEEIEDKIKLQPLKNCPTTPNPISTDELQKKIHPKSVIKRVLYRNALEENLVISTNTQPLDLQDRIDKHASRVPEEALTSFPELLAFFEEPIQNHSSREELLIRYFLVWIGHLISDTGTGTAIEDGDKDQVSIASLEDLRQPTYVLLLLKKNKTTVLSVFTLLCWVAKIKCKKINGIIRTGINESARSAWVAVLIKNTWQLVHPYRVCKAIAEKIPDTTKSYPEERLDGREKIILETYLDHYILSNPEHFIYECLPDEEEWQLLPEAVTKEQFMSQERVFHPIWRTGLQMFSEHGSRLTSDNGRIAIPFITNNSDLIMWYELEFLQDVDSRNEDQQDMLQRCVYLIRNESFWTCEIIFPFTGTYHLILFGGKIREPLFRLCEFEISCDVCCSDPIPLPFEPGVIGLGPGPMLDFAKLYYPSHTSGVIHSDTRKQLLIKFRTYETISVKATLLLPTDVTDDIAIRQPLCQLIQKRTYKEVVICIFPQPIPGQFLLEISSRLLSEYTPVVGCYYLVYFDLSDNVPGESCIHQSARRALKTAIAGNDVDKILLHIQDCKSINIQEFDVDVQEARGRIYVLHKKQKKVYRNRKYSIDPRIQAENIVRQVEYEANVTELVRLTRHFLSLLGEEPSRTQHDNNNENTDSTSNTVDLLICLFGYESGDGTITENQLRDALTSIRQHGLVIPTMSVFAARDLIEQYKEVKSRRLVKSAFKCVSNIIKFLTSQDMTENH